MRRAGLFAALVAASVSTSSTPAAAQPRPVRSEMRAEEGRLRERVTTGPFARLYANTLYNLLDRIEPDGFLPESNDPVRGYDGMYPRTVGATVSLLLTINRPEPAERLLRCVLNAMQYNGMHRIPHAFDKVRTGNPLPPDRYPILGRGDQLDGQAHVIMAWARLANSRGITPFEDSTYATLAALLNASIRPPYSGDTTGGKIPDLAFNPFFEHSRPASVKWRYDLLTQVFVGAALAEMITVARRRHDSQNARAWAGRLQKLKQAVQRCFIVRKDGRPVFAELLLANANKVFGGMGWVNLSPVAAGWNPLGKSVLRNTVDYMERRLSQPWRGLTWLPTDSWPGGAFSPQVIGKGTGWELEFASEENRYQRLTAIVDLVEYLHRDAPIYMENAALCDPMQRPLPTMTADSLAKHQDAFWKLADPGNGEQVSWWCWAVANLRKRLGLDPVPPRIAADSALVRTGGIIPHPRPSLRATRPFSPDPDKPRDALASDSVGRVARPDRGKTSVGRPSEATLRDPERGRQAESKGERLSRVEAPLCGALRNPERAFLRKPKGEAARPSRRGPVPDKPRDAPASDSVGRASEADPRRSDVGRDFCPDPGNRDNSRETLTVTLTTEPSPKYGANGAATLIDGIRGTMDLTENRWLGYQGTDFEADLDLGTVRRISQITLGLMHNPDAWIFLPRKIHLSVSDDSSQFHEVSTLDVTPRAMEAPELRDAPLLSAPVSCRFVRIHAENFGPLPPWHKAAGRNAWLFIDEIAIH